MTTKNNRSTHLVTLEEAKRRGLDFAKPSEASCPYCGTALEPIGVIGLTGTLAWVGSVECECEGATKERERLQEEERRRREREKDAALARCGLKPRFKDARVDVASIAGYLDAFELSGGNGLYICGPSRAGKTYAASAMTKAFFNAGYSVILTTSLAMLDSIKESFDGNSRLGPTRFTGCDVLIIDDLGKENANSWVMTTLFQIVNARYEAMRPTIVTSQYTLDELKSRMSRSGERESAEAIVERLRETCVTITLPPRRNVGLMNK